MKISDILRQLADVIDREDPGKPDASIQNAAAMAPVPTGLYGNGVDAPCNPVAGADDPVMIPPLQLKTELLKKAVGVDNVYDPGEPRADEAHDNQERDMIIVLKKNAGVPTAAVMELSNDDIFDD
jgi:hypothetical protein